MPLTVSDEAFNTPRLLSLYTNICCIATGLMPQFLKYADLRRVLQTEGEEISAKGDDYLGEVLAALLSGASSEQCSFVWTFPSSTRQEM